MQLHHNTTLGIRRTKGEQQCGFILLCFKFGYLLPCHCFGKDPIQFGIGSLGIRHIIQAMVGGTATECAKIIQAFDQCSLNISNALDLNFCRFAELSDIFDVACLININRLIGAIGRQNRHREIPLVLELLMPAEGVDGIVGGADHLHVGAQDQLTH